MSTKQIDPPDGESEQFVQIMQTIVGQRVHEVSYESLMPHSLLIALGKLTSLANKARVDKAISDGEPIPYLRQYQILMGGIPYLVDHASNARVWSADSSYRDEDWSFWRGYPMHHLDLAPRLLGAYVAGISIADGVLRICLSSGCNLEIALNADASTIEKAGDTRIDLPSTVLYDWLTGESYSLDAVGFQQYTIGLNDDEDDVVQVPAS